MQIKEMMELRAKAAAEIRRLADLLGGDKAEFSSEEQEAYERSNAEYDKLGEQIEIKKRADDIQGDIENRADEQIGREDTRGDHRPDRMDGDVSGEAIQGWMREQMGLELEHRHQSACASMGIRPSQKELRIDLIDGDYRHVQEAYESRALSSVTGQAGGYLNPDGFIPQLEIALLKFGGLRQKAEIIRTERGERFAWPSVDDTANVASPIGEAKTVTETDITVKATYWDAYKLSSDLIKVPYELLEDSVIDIAPILSRLLGERLGRKSSEWYMTGTGNAQPYGLVEAATTGVTTAASGAITFDEIIDLEHSVDEEYLENACFMMNRAVLKVVRKMKDGMGQYLWTRGTQAGEPDMLLGYPVITHSSMASALVTTAKTMLFGDLSAYKIRDVKGIRMKRLTERYADEDVEGFVAFLRTDGNLLDAGTHPVKRMVQV